MNTKLRITKLRYSVLSEIAHLNEEAIYPPINRVIHFDRGFLPYRTRAHRYETVHALLNAGYLANREGQNLYNLEVIDKGREALK